MDTVEAAYCWRSLHQGDPSFGQCAYLPSIKGNVELMLWSAILRASVQYVLAIGNKSVRAGCNTN